jgi:hypothetical protein
MTFSSLVIIHLALTSYATLYRFLTDLEAKKFVGHSSVAARALATVIMIAVVPLLLVLRIGFVIYTKSYSFFTRPKKESKNAQ